MSSTSFESLVPASLTAITSAALALPPSFQ
jgi:hypothetical protein